MRRVLWPQRRASTELYFANGFSAATACSTFARHREDFSGSHFEEARRISIDAKLYRTARASPKAVVEETAVLPRSYICPFCREFSPSIADAISKWRAITDIQMSIGRVIDLFRRRRRKRIDGTRRHRRGRAIDGRGTPDGPRRGDETRLAAASLWS